MSNHHIAGLPEWADEELAAETVHALGLSMDAQAPASPEVVPATEWAAAGAYYWAAAYAAMLERRFDAMRAAADVAADADMRVSPEGALLGAVFGMDGKRPQARAVALGAKLAAADVAAARDAVKAELARFAAAQKSRVAADRVAHAAELRAHDKEVRDRKKASAHAEASAGASLVAGQRVEVSFRKTHFVKVGGEFVTVTGWDAVKFPRGGAGVVVSADMRGVVVRPLSDEEAAAERCQELAALAEKHGLLSVGKDGIGYRVAGESVERVSVHPAFGATVLKKHDHPVVALRPLADELGLSVATSGLSAAALDGSTEVARFAFGEDLPASADELLAII